MNTERLLEVGEKGIHLLFDLDAIHEAFGQDADRLREALSGRREEIEFAIQHLLASPDVGAGRRFLQELTPAIRHVVVLLYFELLDGRLRDRSPQLH